MKDERPNFDFWCTRGRFIRNFSPNLKNLKAASDNFVGLSGDADLSQSYLKVDIKPRKVFSQFISYFPIFFHEKSIHLHKFSFIRRQSLEKICQKKSFVVFILWNVKLKKRSLLSQDLNVPRRSRGSHINLRSAWGRKKEISLKFIVSLTDELTFYNIFARKKVKHALADMAVHSE